MRKILIFLAVFMFIFTTGSFASPISLTNVITFTSTGASSSGDGVGMLDGYGRGSVDLLSGTGDYVKWTQSFTFNSVPENGYVTGRLSVKLRDDSSSWLDGPEFAIGWTDSSTWAIGEVDSGIYNYNMILENGTLTVTLASLGGDFYIDSSSLTVDYSSATPVPEPASMVLVGLGMLSVGVFARKKIRIKR